MGGSNSKSTVAISVHTIENNVIGLINKLDAAEKSMDSYIRQQLIQALGLYRSQVEARSRTMSFSQKTPAAQRFRIRDYISQATSKIEKFQTNNFDLKSIIPKTAQEMKSYIIHIQQALKSRQIDQNECERIFKTIKLHVQNLEKKRKQLKRDENDELALIILELYIKCPQKQTSNQIGHLDAFLENLRHAAKNLNKFNPKVAHHVKANQKIVEIKAEMENIRCKLAVIEENLNKSQNKPVSNIASNDEEIVRRSKRPGQDLDQQSKFPKRQTESENIFKSLELLKSIDAKIRSLSSAEMQFSQKEKTLAKYEQETVKVETYNNDEVMHSRIKLLNRIYGLSLLETASYLKQIKITVEKCKNSILRGDDQDKKKILQSLTSNLDKIKSENTHVRKEVQFIRSTIYEISTMLDAKFDENKNISSALKKIHTLEERIDRTASTAKMSLLQKLATFNNCRREMESVENNSTKIREKKKVLIERMQNCEVHLLEGSSEFLRSFKNNLNRRELDVHDLTSPVKEITYQQRMNGLKTFWKKNAASIETHFGHEMSATFEDTVKSISDFLQKIYADDDKNIERLDNIEQSVNKILTSSSVTNWCKLLEPYEDQIQQMKTHATKSEVRNRIEKVQAKILLERSKTELTNLYKELKEDKQTRPTTTNADIFQNKINQLFSLKVRFYNLPDNSELNDQKQKFLDEFCRTLRNIDEYLPEVIYSTQIKILDLNDQFNFRREQITVPKNSVEFVQIIHQNAQSFEDKVKNFAGTNYSVDYYVIYENLTRFLEELDQVNCRNNESLLPEVLKTMDYIKKLLDLLSSNVTSEESVQVETQPEESKINILDLRNQFNFKPEAIDVPRESLEFVQIIHQNAKDFEDRVKNYVGTNYSVDYYVIHENLMQFLEELDKVNCKKNNDLLVEVLKTMDYIKKLLEQLDSVATRD